METISEHRQPFLALPRELVFPSLAANMDRVFIYYLGLRLLELRRILPKQYHVSCNVLICEVQHYLQLKQSHEQLLTVSESRTARIRLSSNDLDPTNYSHTPMGRGGHFTLSTLCLLHSLLNTICSQSSEIQKASGLIILLYHLLFLSR